jgi:hypothetical protein
MLARDSWRRELDSSMGIFHTGAGLSEAIRSLLSDLQVTPSLLIPIKYVIALKAAGAAASAIPLPSVERRLAPEQVARLRR